MWFAKAENAPENRDRISKAIPSESPEGIPGNFRRAFSEIRIQTEAFRNNLEYLSSFDFHRETVIESDQVFDFE